jgi:cytochrome oxidase Cu insertion factor (SCO1/SenC/PrrC family)
MTTHAAAGSGMQNRGRLLRLLLIVSVAAIVLGAGVGVAVHKLAGSSSNPTRLSSMSIVHSRDGLFGEASWAARTHPAPAINTLVDQHGQRFSLGSLHGRTVAMVFFDSHCHAECPLEGRALAEAELALPASERPVLVAVSVNTADTRKSVATAIREWGLARTAPWYWLMGTKAKLAPVWRAYHIQVGPVVNGDIQHTEALYLIDRRGDMRSAYLWPFAGHFVTSDLRTLATRNSKA